VEGPYLAEPHDSIVHTTVSSPPAVIKTAAPLPEVQDPAVRRRKPGEPAKNCAGEPRVPRRRPGGLVKYRAAAALAGAALVVLALPAVSAQAGGPPHVVADPIQHGVVKPHDAPSNAGRSSALMTNHGGKIMTTANIHPIFWGASWPTHSGDKMTGIDTFYAGWGNSRYAGTTTEYAGSNGTAGATSSSLPSVLDASAASGGGSTTTILNEVAQEIAAGAVPLDPTGNGYYPVYSDVRRGTAGYCAWHSSGTVSSGTVTAIVQFAVFFNLDGDAGCDPGDTVSGHSQGLAALGNVSAHELAEAVTDPASPGAWYDSKGAENGDKCAWTFNVPTVSFSNGTAWKVQGEWSNKAFSAGTGYPNSAGQRGCLDGH
jgi:hypothetical protein